MLCFSEMLTHEAHCFCTTMSLMSPLSWSLTSKHQNRHHHWPASSVSSSWLHHLISPFPSVNHYHFFFFFWTGSHYVTRNCYLDHAGPKLTNFHLFFSSWVLGLNMSAYRICWGDRSRRRDRCTRTAFVITILLIFTLSWSSVGDIAAGAMSDWPVRGHSSSFRKCMNCRYLTFTDQHTCPESNMFHNTASILELACHNSWVLSSAHVY